MSRRRSIPFVTMLLAAATALLGCSDESPDLVIHGVDILPMTSNEILANQTVFVRDGVITAIESAGANDGRWPGVEVVFADGKFLIPGLIDAHVHVDPGEDDAEMLLYVANGVTTVQSMDGSPEHLDLRERIAGGELLAPRLLTTGPTTSRERVDSPEKAERIVREQAAAGYDAIKMYGDGSDTMTAETYARLNDAAREAGIRVVGHAPRNLPFSTVLEERQSSIDHMEEILYTHTPIVEALSPLIEVQFGRMALEEAQDEIDAFPGARERVTEAVLADLARRAAEAGLAVTPTLVAFETIRTQTTDGYWEQLNDPELAYVSPLERYEWGPTRNGYRTSWSDRLEVMDRILSVGLETQKMLVGAFHAAGVPIMAGTDAPLTFVYPGFTLHRELELLVESGLTPYDALLAATIVPAQELGIGDRVGSIEVGMEADFVLLDANPLADVSNTTSISEVVLRGRLLSASDLYDGLKSLADSHRPLAEAVDRLRGPLESASAAELVAVYESLDPAIRGLSGFVESAINDLGYDALNDGETERAVEAFALNTETFPESANAWDSLAEGYVHHGETERAAITYRKSLELDPDNEGTERTLEWVELERHAASASPDFTEQELHGLAGDYGPRHVRFEDGALHYSRDEVGTSYRLRPLTRDTFALEGQPIFRLRFVLGEDGRPVKVIGLYFNGRTDESPRT